MLFTVKKTMSFSNGYLIHEGEELSLDLFSTFPNHIHLSHNLATNYKWMERYPIPFSNLAYKTVESTEEVSFLVDEIQKIRKGSFFIHPSVGEVDISCFVKETTYVIWGEEMPDKETSALRALLGEFLASEALKDEAGEVYDILGEDGKVKLRHRYSKETYEFSNILSAIDKFEGLVSGGGSSL